MLMRMLEANNQAHDQASKEMSVRKVANKEMTFNRQVNTDTVLAPSSLRNITQQRETKKATKLAEKIVNGSNGNKQEATKCK